MQGWRTISVGLLVAIGPTVLDYLLKIDWTKIVDPKYAPMIAGTLMIAMRFVTKTPVGIK